jgi:hypothetical protein
MRQRRLVFLLAAMLVLLVLRWWRPPPSDGDSTEVAAAVAPAMARPPALAASAIVAPGPYIDLAQADLSAGTRDLEPLEPRNAFAVRLPPAPAVAPPPPAPPPVKIAAAKPFVGPPAPLPALPPPPPPPPPLPPFQVIGSWRDEQGVSLFVAGPRGVQRVAVGEVLADYRFAQITGSQVMLKHLPSNRDVPLSVPPGTVATLQSSK